jgi:hypothetical protein
MDPNQDQRKKGLFSQGIDSINNSASIAKWGKRALHPNETFNALRGALGLGQAGASATGATAAAGGAEATAGAGGVFAGLGGPIFIGLAVVLLVSALMIFSGGAPAPVVGGDLGSPLPSGVEPSIFPSGPPVDPTSAVARLKSDFNITLVGGTSQQAVSIYNYLSKYLSYPYALTLLRGATPKITIVNGPCPSNLGGGCHASTNSSGDVILYTAFWGDLVTTQQKYLIHEMGHAIGNTNNSLQVNLYKQVHDAGLDSTCFNSSEIIKTYPINPASPNDPVHETFAESIADSLSCGSGTCGGPGGGGGTAISNFPVTCSNTYRYLINNVLK